MNKPRKQASGKSRLLRVLGPGLITGASDDDPSGIATYSQAGAQFGFSITWTMLFSYPLMSVIQEISGRIGRTTGIGLAGTICKHYPNWLLQTLVAALFLANTINIGADLGAMADAVKLLIGGPHLVSYLASPARRYKSSCATSAMCRCCGGSRSRCSPISERC
jgi:Mn2+/Fe2+ NRAMP family transporter